MASLQQKGDAYYCQFIYAGQRHTATIGKVTKTDAYRWKVRAEELLASLKRRIRQLPPGVSIVDFLLFDGNPPVDAEFTPRKDTTLGELSEQYLATVSNGAIEVNTYKTCRIHLSHIEETLGKRFLLSGLTLRRLQEHIERRHADVAPVTIKKEIDTFRAAWNWAARAKLVSGVFPSAGLVYPKTDEKLPMMNWTEVERRLKAGGDPDELWECLYLDTKQLADLLKHVKSRKAPGWVYPMLLTAAHTGMRRSELMRAKPEDIDLKGGVITVREKKRTRNKRTTRRVPISKPLVAVLKQWLATRKGSAHLFGYEERPLSVQAVHKALGRVLAKSKWSVVKGWHTFRHSFISACASKGIDQRLVDSWVGHQTDEQRVRYRHLYPSVQEAAIRLVFG
ncbi:MAG TPA: tyrosine-type recombinase/integrase [Pirellulales bacterium]|nr:tyrosine-type recombinase/integrase [Pirellulales bacterium]